MSRSRLYYLVCRLAIPLWLLAGAIFKLTELNPKLLPPTVFSVVQFFDGWFGSSGNAWLDLSIRLIVLAEFALVAVMLCMPRIARAAAITTLSLFCIILLAVIVPGFIDKGWEGAWKGSCGCFGAQGPSPVIMLGIDATLLVLALFSKRREQAQRIRATFGLPSAVTLAIIGAAATALVPARAEIVIVQPSPPIIDPVVPPVNPLVEPPVVDPLVVNPVVNPPVVPIPAPAKGWPGMPATAAPYYVPDFTTWTGTRLDSQEIARLMTVAPPPTINSGPWFVMFYREDCDHCHELLATHFSGSLSTPTLTISIPDTDPAASLEFPCSECHVRTLLKGPDYVLTTPLLMRVMDGVITYVVIDAEDSSSIDQCLHP